MLSIHQIKTIFVLFVSLKTLLNKLTTYPKNIKFKYNYRKYQQRVLDDLNNHLMNKHLPIVAPPGSGKTVLIIHNYSFF